MSSSGRAEAFATLSSQQANLASERGAIGTFESRLEVAARSLEVIGENDQAAEARITDADTAENSAALVRHKILQDASAAVLAQGNQQPALALTLLHG